MSVRTKLSLSTGVVLLLLLLAVYGGGRPIIVSTLRQAERDAALRVMPLLEEALQTEQKLLAALVTERATADDVYDALAARNPALLPAQYAPDALAAMDLDLLVLADLEGRPVVGWLRDPVAGTYGPLPLSAELPLKPGQPLRMARDRQSATRDLILVENVPVLVAAQAVAGTGTRRVPAGVMVAGRRLDGPGMRNRLSRILTAFSAEATLVIRAYTRDLGPGPSLAGEEESINAGHVVIHGVGPHVLRAILPLHDVYGKPAVSIVATMSRTYSQRAEWALTALTGVIASIGLLFELILFFVQSRTVLDPLTRLADEIRSYHGGDATSRRIGWSRTDEFGVVAREVDRMLDSIEQKHASVEENERRNRALLEANPDLMAVFDREGMILDAHVSEDASLMGPAEVVRGRSLDQINLPPAVAARFRGALAHVLDSGKQEIFEYVRPHGEEALWGEARLVRMDESRVLAILRDITSRKRGEEEHARMNEKIRQIQKLESLGVLASGVAHDFNNLLTIIVGYAELTKASLTENVTAIEMTDNIRDSAKRAAGLAKQMLAYAGQGGFEFDRIEVNHLLNDMNPLLRAAVSKKAALEISLDPDLPVIAGDSVQLRQMVMNLAVNASEAMSEQIGRISVTTRRVVMTSSDLVEFLSAEPLRPGVYALIEVQDNGCGMDAATMARAFDPFFSTKAVGRGLGLSATLGLVRAHHGGISVHSKPREGTTFRILLPPAPASVAAPGPTAPSTLARSSGALVMVIDDEEDIRRIGTLMLQSAGYEVISAGNGREAMRLFAQYGPKIGLILLDVEMPIMNGSETFQAIRQTGSNVPIIIVSGYGDSMIRRRFSTMDPAGFLFKPFSSDQLVASAVLAMANAPRA